MADFHNREGIGWGVQAQHSYPCSTNRWLHVLGQILLICSASRQCTIRSIRLVYLLGHFQFLYSCGFYMSFPGGSVMKNPPANAGDTGSIPGLGRSPEEGFLPGKFHCQRSLVGYSPWGCKESDNLATEHTCKHTHTWHLYMVFCVHFLLLP